MINLDYKYFLHETLCVTVESQKNHLRKASHVMLQFIVTLYEERL